MDTTLTTIPLPGPVDLLVKIGHGSVTVTTRDGLGEAVVRLRRRDPDSDVLDRTTVELRRSTLVVAGPRQGGLADLIGSRRMDRDGVEAELEVPTGTAVTIVTASADITVTGACGDADIVAGRSSIALETVAGDLRLRSSRADTRVGTVRGSVQLRAGSGTARLGEIGSRLDCGLGSGELWVEVVRGELRARAGSGSVRIGAAHGNVDVASGSGPISVGIPPGVSARVDVASGAGRAESELSVEQEPAPDARPISVRARTGHGDVRLLRAPAG